MQIEKLNKQIWPFCQMRRLLKTCISDRLIKQNKAQILKYNMIRTVNLLNRLGMLMAELPQFKENLK